MPTTSQGLIVNDTAPKVFFSISATGVLCVPILPFFTHRLSAAPRNSFIRILFFNIYITLFFLVQWIYVVVTIEQTIQRNPVIHNGPRFPISFGQVCGSSQVDYYVC